ncbi:MULTISPECIES: MinD/ParA family protein [Brevibacillus]|jgi:flagellar biosynthesis protein FlhG|uniref:ATPase n=1 Tax=Brevibacillus parabrevis TaxID=54914 RepID=A0A4Y3P8Y7_BREPA|nr:MULTISPECIES: MinD/ParA family protein [Brevibacillus]MBU8711395.1 MinD/ParA family protein [Brevibacillus parabrevis]MDR4999429.1 MinD/ParA family protein [Brevibacillus parabrevis]MED2254010.1 MinD/ParA family protein [Brevibacillus parabrevis]NRQ53660.1 MinD/ParA family protein [Brevibacillus sp. HD1.4A]RNB94306.1 MinD/ParA family protein [Brevibacillus parabrevis]
MRDQAEQLRMRMQQSGAKEKTTRLVTVTSGKGGVGKSNFSLNFGLGLLERGHKAVLFDVDLGLANLDVLMGITPKKHLFHLLEPDTDVWEIIEHGPGGLEFIAGGSGFTQIMQLDEAKLDRLFTRLEPLQGYADTIIFDTGAGFSKESLRFMLSSDEVILVTTPEPPAITDAYAVIKMLHARNPAIVIRLVINRASSEREGRMTADKLAMVAKRFLDMDIQSLGYVSDDPHVSKAVKQQRPFLLTYPQSQAAKSIRNLVDRYLDSPTGQDAKTNGLKGFLARLKHFIR